MTAFSSNAIKSIIKTNAIYFWALAVLLLFGIAVLSLGEKGDVVVFFAQNRQESLNTLFRFTTYLGEGYAFVAIGAILLIWGNWSHFWAMIFNVLVVVLGSQSLKHFFGAPRPAIYFTNIVEKPELLNPVPDVELTVSWTSSFPSGHTMAAFALYGFVAFLLPQRWAKLVCLLIASMVGLSRIYLAQHFLSDVLAGAFLGTVAGLLAYVLQQYLQERKWGKSSLGSLLGGQKV